jgi:hypothetical protein
MRVIKRFNGFKEMRQWQRQAFLWLSERHQVDISAQNTITVWFKWEDGENHPEERVLPFDIIAKFKMDLPPVEVVQLAWFECGSFSFHRIHADRNTSSDFAYILCFDFNDEHEAIIFRLSSP